MGAQMRNGLFFKSHQFLYLKERKPLLIMINNNPYNLPDRPPQKQPRVYTEANGSHFRSDSIENIPNYNQCQNRGPLPPSMIMKRSTINIEEVPSNFRPPYYPTVRNDVKHYLPSPKSQNTSSTGTLNSFGISHALANGEPKKEMKQMRESFGISLDFKEVNEKIEVLSIAIKNNEKRIAELQKNSSGSQILSNYSKLSDHPLNDQRNTSELYQQFVTKYEEQWIDGMKKLKDDILHVRQQVKTCIKSNDADKIIKEKVKQIKDVSRIHQEMHLEQNMGKNQEMMRLRKDVDRIYLQLEQKMRKNYEMVTSIVARLQKELHQNIISPPYKSTGIKCTGTAILLRFVQCFKVRKNNSFTPTKAGGSEVKVTVSDNTYYIDCEGYLLDKEQHYLVDNRGIQVRLEERHIRMLKDENVFC